MWFQQIHFKNDENKRVEVVGIAAGKTHSMVIAINNSVFTCGKMKSSMYLNDENPYLLDTFDGYGGLGYFQGIASAGHVPTFKVVSQLKDVMSFGHEFSTNTSAKLNFFVLGIYFDKKTENITRDRLFVAVQCHCPSPVLYTVFRHTGPCILLGSSVITCRPSCFTNTISQKHKKTSWIFINNLSKNRLWFQEKKRREHTTTVYFEFK